MKIRMRRRRGQVEDQWLSDALDRATEQDLQRLSIVHSELHMTPSRNEKLAWSVIDKAELADEEELERRRKFRLAQRKKHLTRILIGCGVFAILISILAWAGVFDAQRLHSYRYSVQDAQAVGGEKPDVDVRYQSKDWQRGVGKEFPKVNEDLLDNTVYQAFSEYCKKHDYAVWEYKILSREKIRQKDGTYLLVCQINGQCRDMKRDDDGTTWADVMEQEKKTPEDYPLQIDPKVSANMYTVLFTLAVEIPER